MGILHARPELEPGESLFWKAAANHVAGPSYALWGMTSSSSGRLVVTDRRVFFQPSRVDTLFRQRRWEKQLGAVTGVELIGRDGEEVFAGGMRERLGIRSADGVEVFVVNGLETKIAYLRNLYGLEGDGGPR
jgi:hypothetical protein